MSQRNPMEARRDMTVDEMIDLIRNAPPGPWPNEWAALGQHLRRHAATM